MAERRTKGGHESGDTPVTEAEFRPLGRIDCVPATLLDEGAARGVSPLELATAAYLDACMGAAVCGHCHRPITQASRGICAHGAALCHTGTVPPDDEPRDCYRLVTVYQHKADGSCCR